MMFDMVIHVPVEEPHNRAEDDRPRVETKVGRVIDKTDVLGVVTQKKQPAAVKWGEGEDEQELPRAEIEGEGGN